MIAEAISGFMTGTVKPILDKFVPDAKERLVAEQAIMNALLESDRLQADINKIEAANTSLFVSGWRPCIGWICGASLAYASIGYSVFNWVMAMVNPYTAHTMAQLPAPDTTITLEILMAMLGLGGLRTYEKLKGVGK
jgi:hypothetical protein